MKKIPSFLSEFISWFIKYLILFIGYTSKATVLNSDHFKKYASKNKPVIFALWHENVVLAPFFYHCTVKGKRLVSMVSRSQDGEILAKIFKRFHGATVRGSSSRGGVVALRQIADEMIKGGDAGMVPDGPRGPAFKIQPGVLKLAQLSGAPILACGIEYARRVRIKSWDRMKIPFPLNRICLSFGNPIHIASDANEEDLKEARELLIRELKESTEKAKKQVFYK